MEFLFGLVRVTSLVGLLMALWPLLAGMAPAADAYAPLVVDLSTTEPGERRLVRHRGQPIYIVNRTPEQIAAVRADDDAQMPSPQHDADRVQRAEWLVVVAAPENSWFCLSDLGRWCARWPRGRYGGWYAYAGDQYYDLSGRLREGRRATRNLPIPEYSFLTDTILLLE